MPSEMESGKEENSKQKRMRNKHSTEDYLNFYRKCQDVSNEMAKSEWHYYRRSLQKIKHTYKMVFQICNYLLGWTKQSPLPESTSNIELANRLITFFTTKILNIQQQLVEKNTSLEHNTNMTKNRQPCQHFFSFSLESVFKASRTS